MCDRAHIHRLDFTRFKGWPRYSSKSLRSTALYGLTISGISFGPTLSIITMIGFCRPQAAPISARTHGRSFEYRLNRTRNSSHFSMFVEPNRRSTARLQWDPRFATSSGNSLAHSLARSRAANPVGALPSQPHQPTILSLMQFLLSILFFAAAATAPYDLVIRNGHVIDGTGSPWYAGDVAIRGGRIAAIGRLDGAAARRTLDARGMVVAPGFIDMLGQSELTILVNPHLPSKIFQGITTEITGEGGSIAPLNDQILKADRVTYEHYGISPDWRTYAEYFARLRKQGMGINLASYVGA